MRVEVALGKKAGRRRCFSRVRWNESEKQNGDTPADQPEFATSAIDGQRFGCTARGGHWPALWDAAVMVWKAEQEFGNETTEHVFQAASPALKKTAFAIEETPVHPVDKSAGDGPELPPASGLRLFLYALGSLGPGLMGAIVMFFQQAFLLEVVQIDPAYVAPPETLAFCTNWHLLFPLPPTVRAEQET